MPGQASIGGSSTSSSTTHLEVMGHQTHTSGDDGNTGEEQKDDDGEHDDEEFEDGMDRLLHCSGLDGWETDLDEDAEMEEKEEKEEKEPPNAVETVHPDNMETLELDTESMDHTMAIESQWRLCGDQGGEDKESDHEDEKKPEELEDSKDLLTTHKICIIHYTVHLK